MHKGLKSQCSSGHSEPQCGGEREELRRASKKESSTVKTDER